MLHSGDYVGPWSDLLEALLVSRTTMAGTFFQFVDLFCSVNPLVFHALV